MADVRPNVNDIAARRLHAQGLTGEPLASPVEVVRRLTAVQSQDYAGAKWAIGQRSRATETEIDRLFDKGAILRTHVLRPTWHFVLPEDIRWLLDLTGPRVRRGLGGRHRALEIDPGIEVRAAAVFTASLAGGRHLTRRELGESLLAAGISPEGQRLPHFLLGAELDGLIVNGPRRGREFTYALLEERVPEAASVERAEAVAELTRRYFQSHGPAQIQDFVWWSGLTGADAKAGIALAKPGLEHQAIDGQDYWFDANAGPLHSAARGAHLLPNFDEYSVAYRDRTALLHADQPFDPKLFAFGSILSNVVLVDGHVRGAWRLTAAGGGLRVAIRTLGRLATPEIKAIEESGRRLAQFHERPVELIWS